ncbi:MAG: NAD(P)-dependent oxidoreductase [Gammaproteobacteria bacterium]|nr:NAD(P)-dependent oxidoreductase [Gammaproteobacteria bacterium]
MIAVSITGANGYIGKHLVCKLAHSGNKVFAYDVYDEPNQHFPNTVVYQKVDLNDPADLVKINYGVDYFLHFAGVTGTASGFTDFKELVEVNELGLLAVLTKLGNLSTPPHFVFPSTRLVYKGQDTLLNEESEKEAKTVYAVNKLASECYIKAYSNKFDFSYTIYRICVPYGNLFDDQFSFGTIKHFLSKAKNKQNIQLFGDGSLRRTFTHIEHLCKQIISSMTSEYAINQELNIAGETHSLKEVAVLIANRFGVAVEHVPWDKDAEKIESGSTVFSSKKIEQIIGTQGSYRFEEWVHQLQKEMNDQPTFDSGSFR